MAGNYPFSQVSADSPAKINLALKVEPLKKDGFHPVATVYMAVTLYDRLVFKNSASGIKTVMNPEIPGPPESNLIYRGALLLQEEFGITRGAEISAVKSIPAGGGLGGGSGNGTAALMALSRLWGLEITDQQLLKLSARLGSDGAFFAGTSPTFGTGRGELLKPIYTDGPLLHFVLVCPPFGVSTAEAYRWWDEDGSTTENPRWDEIFEAVKKGDASLLGPLMFNDLEKPVIARFPQIGEIKNRLTEAGALRALMSGSGSSVLGLFGNRQEAEGAIPKLQGLGRIHYVSSINGPSVRIYDGIWREE